MRDLLCEQGIAEDDIAWLDGREVPRRSILGVDYYEWNERLIDSNGQRAGARRAVRLVCDRRPILAALPASDDAHRNQRMDAHGAPRWLWRQWHNVQLLRRRRACRWSASPGTA